MRQLAVLGAHAAAAIEQQHDGLVALFLVLARYELHPACGRLPVDLALYVALAVLAQLVELEALAAALALQHADARQAVVGREQRVPGDRGEVRIDPYRPPLGRAQRALPQAERRGNAQLELAERVLAAGHRPRDVGKLGDRARRHSDP